MKGPEWLVGKFNKVPILLHWSVLLAFPIAAAGSRSWSGGCVAQLAMLSLIIAHEMGHALIARHHGLQVFRIRLRLTHGECDTEGTCDRAIEAQIAWGGVIAQLVMLVAALSISLAASQMSYRLPQVLAPVFFVFVPINCMLIFVNLLPISPLDGSRAWRGIPDIYRRLVERRKKTPKQRGPNLAAKRAAGIVDIKLEEIARRRD